MNTFCGTCVFWMPSERVGEAPTPLFGQCRRFPPSIILTPDGARGRWPRTNRTEWCGEHTILERAPATAEAG